MYKLILLFSTELTVHHHLYDVAMEHRQQIVETLADFDEDIANHVLNDLPHMELSATQLAHAIRQPTLDNKLVPVLCGSAARNSGKKNDCLNNIKWLFK